MFASKVIIISHYSRLCTQFFKKTKPRISRLLSKYSERVRSSQIWNERDAFACFGELRIVMAVPKVGRGPGDGDGWTRVRGSGTRGRDMWDAGTRHVGRGDVTCGTRGRDIET